MAINFSDYMGREFLMQNSLIVNGSVGLPVQTGLRNRRSTTRQSEGSPSKTRGSWEAGSGVFRLGA